MASDYRPETRQDCLRRQWIACAPQRSGRPRKTEVDPDASAPSPTDDTPVEGCPFCPGHEEQLPSVRWQLDADDERPWETRVVPNKYSALTPDAPEPLSPKEASSGLYRARSNHGRQEVVIDTPYHHQGLARMPTGQVDAVLETYQARYRTLRQDHPTLYPFLFRNHGARAGASIPHPHSQIIAPHVAPPSVKREERAARARHEETDRCPYCEMIEVELRAGSRLVWTNEDYVVFVPYAAQVPYEMWILPRTHDPEFGRITAPQRQSLAEALHTAVRRLHNCLDDPDYNVFVRTALDYESEAPYLHWSLRLQPRTSVEAGFELSTNLRINPSIPERDAAVLRGEE